MNLDRLTGIAPERKAILIVNPDTPGIENLRWRQLAQRMIPQPVDVPRHSHHAAEHREVPTGLFSSLFNELTIAHGAAVAISCLHQTEDTQILVCTSAFFAAATHRYLRSTQVTAAVLQSQLDELLTLMASLEVLSAADDAGVEADCE